MYGDETDARLVLSNGEFAGHSLDKRLLQLEVSTGNFIRRVHHKGKIQRDRAGLGRGWVR